LDPELDLRLREDRPFDQVRYGQQHFTTEQSTEAETKKPERSKLKSQKLSEKFKESKKSDYADYQSDGRFNNEPQFPAYSNWQPADDLGTFRINSPRKQDIDQLEELPARKNEKQKNGDYISVKLPDDILKHLGKQYGLDKNKHVQTQILGIPSDHLAHLDDIDFDDEPANDLKNNYPESLSTTTTTTTTTTEKAFNQKLDFHNNFKNREQEYYNKKDLIPKITENAKENSDVNTKMKVPEQNPLDPNRRSLWKVAWQAHIYFSGTLFVLLAIYCTVNVCRLHTFSRLFSRGYFLSLNVCMIIIGLGRGFFLLFDPYNEKQSLPSPLAYMLLNVGYPCITSAFAILFLALLRVTQVELLSPAVQTPKALAVFCCIHLAISLALDVTVGLVSKLQYILLLGQGIFIVWSLLLSAGYFYIYSTMKKVVSRQQCDMNRSVYPKLMFDQAGSGTYSMRLPPPRSNPLSRAVNLTLGVAVIGSLMGGVQLYGMIGMHGLLRSDPKDIPDPWYGYQVALRVFEVMMCYLLAVVATTPLRQDSGGSPRSSRGPCSSCSPLLCCNGEGFCQKCGAGDNPPTQLDEDIYTEICSNNQSVRVLNSAESSCYNQAMIPMGTQSTNNSSLALSASGQQLTSTLARKRPPVAGRNSGGCQSQVSGDSSATLDTALYSNLRSRPSSMLFNDAGFVRFRLGNDPSLAQGEVLRQSCQDLTIQEQDGSSETVVNPSLPDKPGSESMKGSRSFDNSVLDKKQMSAEFTISPLERPHSNMSYVREVADSRLIKSELCSPDRPDVEFLPGLPNRPASKLATHSQPARTNSPLYNRPESDTDVGEQYETPAGMVLPETTKSLAAQVRSVIGYSESDLSSVDPLYGGKSIYGYSRAPSRCSSISATQSFDMRVYGRTGIGPGAAATLGRPVDKAKLDNKYYYYGSTRGQKKSSQPPKEKETLTPRPLLPSQRNQDSRLGPSPTPPVKVSQGPSSTPGQSIYDQIMGREQQSPKLPNFQRSRSLGHHYQREASEVPNLPPRPPGPRTPTSVARRVLESVTKRRNKDKHLKQGRPSYGQKEGYMTAPGPIYQTSDGRLVSAPGPLLQLDDGRLVAAPGPLVQMEDGRIVALAPAGMYAGGQPIQLTDPRMVPNGLVQTPDGRLVVAGTSQRARQISQDRDQMLYGTREEVNGEREAFNRAHGILGDKLNYLPQNPEQRNYPPSQHNQEPIYERRADLYGRLPFGTRLQGEIRQVLGTPPATRHAPLKRPDSRGEGRIYPTTEQSALRPGDQQAARLAGQHYLASPPDLNSRRGHQRERGDPIDDTLDSDIQSSVDQYPSQATQGYNEGLADNELDSEISSLFGGGDGREARLQNLHLMSPLEYAAMLKQYTEPCGILGQDITPDSGVVVDSRNHSKERESHDARQRRDNFVVSSRAISNPKHEIIDSNESSDSSGSSSGSRGRNDSLLLRNGRYKRVPTSDEQIQLQYNEREGHIEERLRNKSNENSNQPDRLEEAQELEMNNRHRQPSSLSEPEVVTDSEAVSESNTEYSAEGPDRGSDTDYDQRGRELRYRDKSEPAAEKIVTVCNEIKQRFQTDQVNTDDENVI